MICRLFACTWHLCLVCNDVSYVLERSGDSRQIIVIFRAAKRLRRPLFRIRASYSSATSFAVRDGRSSFCASGSVWCVWRSSQQDHDSQKRRRRVIVANERFAGQLKGHQRGSSRSRGG
jgi:hypothetical protein